MKVETEIDYWKKKSDDEQAIHILMDFVRNVHENLSTNPDKNIRFVKRAQDILSGDKNLLDTINKW